MGTTFPNTLDAFVNPASATHLDQPGVRHSDQHININDSVEAVEAKLGVNLSSVTTSIDYISNLFLLTQTEHPSGGYREIEYNEPNNSLLPSIVRWYTDSGKTIILVEKTYSYSGIVPDTITLNLYDGTVSNVIVRTIIDMITYTQGILENSRTRVVI